MNPQTKTMLKAVAIGFAISLPMAAYRVGTGELDPIDPRPFMMGSRTGELAALPLVFAVGAIIFRARKVPGWVSGLNLVGAVTGIFLVCTMIVVAVGAAYPVPDFPFASPGPRRDSFVKGVMRTCVRTQRDYPANRGMSDNAIETACRCYADAMADIAKKEYLDHRQKTGTLPPAAMSDMQAAAEKCARSARN